MKKIAFIFLVIAISISGLIFISRMGPGWSRNILLLINLICWLAFVAMYPVAVVRSGVVSGTQPTSLSYRRRDPIGFWVGLIATSLFWFFVFGLVIALTYIAWFTPP